MRLELDFILQSIKGTLLKGSTNCPIEGVSTDSRITLPGQLFFALPGEKGDGHDYVKEALAAGAAGVVISRIELARDLDTDRAVIAVGDTLTALQDLAAHYRLLFSLPIVAVTGSVGKTTTKDILAVCLHQVQETLKTPGNYNNEIGLPLTLMGLEKSHGAAVVELAMRATGEIAALAAILRPTHAIITNIAPVHLETMGSMDNIARAKCEVLEYVPSQGFALINGDQELLVEAARPYVCRKFTFGYGQDCDFRILATEIAGYGINISLKMLDSPWMFHFPVPATPLALNVAAAAGTAYLLGMNIGEIRTGLLGYQPEEHRLNIRDLAAGGTIIDDTYNANPLSMQVALQTCRDISRGRRTVAVLGDMAELGEYESAGHLEVGRYVSAIGIDLLLSVGPRAELIAQGALQAGMPAGNVKHYPNQAQADQGLKLLDPADVVLFKASRMMRLEELARAFLAQVEGGNGYGG